MLLVTDLQNTVPFLVLSEDGLDLRHPPEPGNTAAALLSLHNPVMLRTLPGDHVTLAVREILHLDELTEVAKALQRAFPDQAVSVVTGVQSINVTRAQAL